MRHKFDVLAEGLVPHTNHIYYCVNSNCLVEWDDATIYVCVSMYYSTSDLALCSSRALKTRGTSCLWSCKIQGKISKVLPSQTFVA